jgi:type IV secretory pathway VirB10-like protein
LAHAVGASGTSELAQPARRKQSALEQALEAATIGITESLGAASVGYSRDPKSAARARRRERARNQKRIVRWADLETSNGSANGSDSSSGKSNVWKRSRSHDSYHERGKDDQPAQGGDAEDEAQRQAFKDLVRALEHAPVRPRKLAGGHRVMVCTCISSRDPAPVRARLALACLTALSRFAQVEKERTETQSFVAKALNASLTGSPVPSDDE